MSRIRYFKVECGKCGQHIEGEMEGFERLIQCPTCSAYILARPSDAKQASATAAPLQAPSPMPIPPLASGERGTADAAKVYCFCPQCSQKLEFSADLVGKEIDCPNCGPITQPDWIQSKPSIPVPPPIRPARAVVSTGKPQERTPALIPSKPAALPAPPLTVRKGESRMRTIVTVIVATVVLLAIALPSIYVWHKRAQKTDQLKSELRLLEAQIQTGVSYNDFLAQVARVRAAYSAAQEVLNESQKQQQYQSLDLCLELCTTLWNPSTVEPGSEWYVGYGEKAYNNCATLFARFGIDGLELFDPNEHRYGYKIHDCVEQMFHRITEDIEAFLQDQPCPWPK
jgi:DNA-directed RNA polymerase subunit RPC12/RpoP